MDHSDLAAMTAPMFTASQVIKETEVIGTFGTASTASALIDANKKLTESRKLAEKKLEQMITCTGPELFVHGAYSDTGKVQDVTLPEDDEDEQANIPGASANVETTCKEAAPFDMILEFMTAVMTRGYENALRVGKDILQFEPDNKIVADFIPVLEEIVSFSDSEDDTSESENSSDSSGSSSDDDSNSETGDDDSERSPSGSAESDDEEDEAGNAHSGDGDKKHVGKSGQHGHINTSSSESLSQASCTSNDDSEDGSGASDDGYDSEELKNMNQLVNNVLKF